MRKHYIGLVHTAGPIAYGISFPDFPGAVTAARTIDEAVEHAREVLAFHAEGMLADGEPIPPPSSFEDVKMLALDNQGHAGARTVRTVRRRAGNAPLGRGG